MKSKKRIHTAWDRRCADLKTCYPGGDRRTSQTWRASVSIYHLAEVIGCETKLAAICMVSGSCG